VALLNFVCRWAGRRGAAPRGILIILWMPEAGPVMFIG
jgi:hypothetical protein